LYTKAALAVPPSEVGSWLASRFVLTTVGFPLFGSSYT
jgi:hypothetical protein